MTRLIQLFCVLLFVCGCASDSHHSTEPIEEASTRPPNYYGTWQWPTGGQSGNRAGSAGAMASQQGAAANAGAAASSVGVESGAAGRSGPDPTASAGTGSTGATTATGGQPSQVPSSSGGGLGLTTVGGSSGYTSSAGLGGLAFGGSDSRTTALAGNSGSPNSMATGGASSGVRVVFASKTGTTTDSTIATVVRLENNTNTSLPLGPVSVSYWANMAINKQIECFCDTPICTAAKVGTFRTSRRGTNTCIEYTFTPGYSVDSGKSIQLVFNCHYVDDSPIDETTHYSEPYRLEAGDEMPHVTVEIGTVVAWGVEPQW